MTVTTTGTPASFVAGIRSQLERLTEEALAAAEQAMNEGMQAGQEIARDRIEGAITPTGLERMKREGGHPGRIETESFWNEFDFESRRVGDNSVEGRLGWLEGGWVANGSSANPEKSYYEYQEDGTVDVQGVHALTDAAEIAKDEFKARLEAWRDGAIR